MPTSMRAVRFVEHGDPDVLVLERVPVPEPGERGLLVRMRAASLNPVDAAIRAGAYPTVLTGAPPRGLGIEVGGEVVAVGAAVTRFRVGDRVIGSRKTFEGETFAEYATLPEADASVWPDALPPEEAGAFPLVALTAYEGLVDKGRLRSGQRVLVNGASGGVGHVAVQLAAALGADVTGVASGGASDFVLGLGARRFVDYHAQDVTALDARFDVVFDVAGTLDFDAAQAVLAPRGHVVSTKVTPGHLALVAKTKVLPGPSFHVCQVAPDGARLDLLLALRKAGALRVHVDRTFPLADVAEAQRYLDEARPHGKVALRIAEETAEGSTTDEGPA